MPKNNPKNINLLWHSYLGSMFFATLAMLPEHSFADAPDTPVGDIFCTIGLWSVGNFGKGLATIATVMAGIGALLSKISWGAVLILGLNISVIFGAGAIIEALNVGTPSGCDTNVATGLTGQSGIQDTNNGPQKKLANPPTPPIVMSAPP